jgi:hypothetical protein
MVAPPKNYQGRGLYHDYAIRLSKKDCGFLVWVTKGDNSPLNLVTWRDVVEDIFSSVDTNPSPEIKAATGVL